MAALIYEGVPGLRTDRGGGCPKAELYVLRRAVEQLTPFTFVDAIRLHDHSDHGVGHKVVKIGFWVAREPAAHGSPAYASECARFWCWQESSALMRLKGDSIPSAHDRGKKKKMANKGTIAARGGWDPTGQLRSIEIGAEGSAQGRAVVAEY